MPNFEVYSLTCMFGWPAQRTPIFTSCWDEVRLSARESVTGTAMTRSGDGSGGATSVSWSSVNGSQLPEAVRFWRNATDV